MKRILFLFFMFSILLSLISCEQSTENDSTNSNDEGNNNKKITVYGKVTCSSKNDPIAGATVSIIDSEFYHTDVTDANGDYRIAGIDASSKTELYVTAKNYLVLETDLYTAVLDKKQDIKLDLYDPEIKDYQFKYTEYSDKYVLDIEIQFYHPGKITTCKVNGFTGGSGFISPQQYSSISNIHKFRGSKEFSKGTGFLSTFDITGSCKDKNGNSNYFVILDIPWSKP